MNTRSQPGHSARIAATWIASALMRLVVGALLATYRYQFHTPGRRRTPVDGPYAFALWHQNILASIASQHGRPHVAMVSRSHTADPLVNLLESWGHSVVRGSSRKRGRDKGGATAMQQMVATIKRGTPGAITPDGPTGPPHVVKPGIVGVAQTCGVPIVPLLAVGRRYWSFKTWDRFRLPKPFTTIDVYYGDPIPVPKDLPPDQRQVIQDRIATAMAALEQHRHRELGTAG